MKPLITLLTLAFITTLFILYPHNAHARVIDSEGIATVAAGDVIDDDLFIGGEQVMIEGTVNGDVYAAGSVITVNGTVNGDVIAAGGTVIISGIVQDDVRIAGGNITLQEAQVGDNVSVAGGTIILDERSTVGGSALIAGGVVTINGPVGRNVHAAAGSLTLNNQVAKSAKVSSDNLIVGEKALLNNGLTYYSTREATISEKAIINGDVVKKVAPEGKTTNTGAIAATAGVGFSLFMFLSTLLVGVVLLYVVPRPLSRITGHLNKDLKSTVGWGFLVFILALPVILILMVTGVGVPLALILMGLFFLELYLAPIFVGIVLSRFILKNLGNKTVSAPVHLVIGLLVYYLLMAIPAINVLVWLATRIIALGSIFLYKREVLGTRA